MASSPLLSIAIPTYNRASFLHTALQALLDQCDEATTPLIEIVVSDNASNDNTRELIQDLNARHSQVALRYFRQPTTVNGNRNILAAAAYSRGMFVYILSDDDVLLPGALSKLLHAIKADTTLAAICLNFRSLSANVSTPAPRAYRLESDLITEDKNEALTQVGTFVTFISAMAFRREAVTINTYYDKVSTSLPHSFLFLDVLAGTGRLLITSEPFLAVRANNSGGYDYFEVFATNFDQVLAYAERIGFSRIATNRVRSRHIRHLLLAIYAFKTSGAIGRLKPNYSDAVKRLARMYGTKPIFWLGVLPLVVLPPQYARLLHRAWICIKSEFD